MTTTCRATRDRCAVCGRPKAASGGRHFDDGMTVDFQANPHAYEPEACGVEVERGPVFDFRITEALDAELVRRPTPWRHVSPAAWEHEPVIESENDVRG